MNKNSVRKLLGFLRRRGWIVVLAVPCLMVMDAFLLEPYWPQTTYTTIPIAQLPAAFEQTRIVLISDWHCDRQREVAYLQECVEKVNQLHPDIVAVAGDYTTFPYQANVDAVLAMLKDLRAPLGVFLVFGNHDYKTYDRFDGLTLPNYITRECQNSSVTVLRNAAAAIEKDQQRLYLVGLGEELFNDFKPQPAFAGIAPEAATLVLVHSPDCFVQLQNYPFSLMLAGHTHGGQICLPFVGPLIVPHADKTLIGGMYQRDGKTLYITRGLGRLGRIRFYCRPEISVITLTAAP